MDRGGRDLQRVRSLVRSVDDVLRELEAQRPKRFSNEELISFTSNFATKIGSGGCGDVYKGMFNDVEIAVKVIKENVLDTDTFTAEVSTLARTAHRNLVKLYGYCFSGGMKAIVYEYMTSGSLGDYLYEQTSDIIIPWGKLYDIAIETGVGLSYVHDGGEEQIIHYDIKASNVLLDSDLCPKIGDFGLARFMPRDWSHITMSQFKGTPGYAAPEAWMPVYKVNCSCDVYSFGMMLFEVLGRRSNRRSEGWFPTQVWEKFEKRQLGEIFRDCLIGDDDIHKAEILSAVAIWCIQFTSQARPSMTEVVKMLREEVPVNRKPPNPFLPTQAVYEPSIISEVNEILDGLQTPEREVETRGLASSSASTPALESSSTPDDPVQNTEQTVLHGIRSIQLNGTNRVHRTGELSQRSRNLRAQNILSSFPKKYPPGFENSVIIYTTTKGSSKMLRECNEVRSILESHTIKIRKIYRDCNLISNYNNQLKDIMGSVKIPIIFVKGSLIGGANEVKKLHQEGKLRILFENLT